MQNHLPAGTMSSSQNPSVGNQRATTPPATAGAGKAQSNLIGELTFSGIFAIGNATLNVGSNGQLTWLNKVGLWENGASRHRGDSQSKNYKDFHVVRLFRYKQLQFAERVHPIFIQNSLFTYFLLRMVFNVLNSLRRANAPPYYVCQ